MIPTLKDIASDIVKSLNIRAMTTVPKHLATLLQKEHELYLTGCVPFAYKTDTKLNNVEKSLDAYGVATLYRMSDTDLRVVIYPEEKFLEFCIPYTNFLKSNITSQLQQMGFCLSNYVNATSLSISGFLNLARTYQVIWHAKSYPICQLSHLARIPGCFTIPSMQLVAFDSAFASTLVAFEMPYHEFYDFKTQHTFENEY